MNIKYLKFAMVIVDLTILIFMITFAVLVFNPSIFLKIISILPLLAIIGLSVINGILMDKYHHQTKNVIKERGRKNGSK